tara:strand:- start:1450 stop:1653 length:204 start_codon:yes stop_codon:yes gene_type:complete
VLKWYEWRKKSAFKVGGLRLGISNGYVVGSKPTGIGVASELPENFACDGIGEISVGESKISPLGVFF